MSDGTALLDYLNSNSEDMVSLLRDLVTLETPSDVPESQAAIHERLGEEFAALGYRTIRVPGRNSGGQLYAAPRLRDRARPIQLMLGHCDTVWPIGTLQTMPWKQDGDTISGPGVYDMKAGLVEMLFSIRALQALNIEPSVVPVCFINSDEEVGSRESTRYIRSLAGIVDRCLVLEPSLGPSGQIKTARKGVGRFTIKVSGKAAHAGLEPGEGASAILELSHIIQEMFRLNDPDRGISVNVGLIDGGVRANVVAPESSAIADVRVESREDADRIEKTILGLEPATPGVSLSIEGGIGRPPMERTPANRQLWKVATESARELDMNISEGTAGGGSDGNTTSLYTATLDGLGAVGAGAHATHEQIDINLLPTRCALLSLLLQAPALTVAS